jgi:hypothetical protein
VCSKTLQKTFYKKSASKRFCKKIRQKNISDLELLYALRLYGVLAAVKGPAICFSVTPVVGGWVRVRNRDRVRFIFSMFFYRVVELLSPRNAQKRDKQIEKKIGFGFLVEFFVKTFRHDFFCKTFFVVFLNSHR